VAVKRRLKHLVDKIKESRAVLKRFHLRIRFDDASPYRIDDYLRGQSFLPLTEVHEVKVAHTADLCEVCNTKSKTAFKNLAYLSADAYLQCCANWTTRWQTSHPVSPTCTLSPTAKFSLCHMSNGPVIGIYVMSPTSKYYYLTRLADHSSDISTRGQHGCMSVV
jgi:hypothetical protein